MILIIDNYDSFTYNLVQYIGELGADVAVARNDQITLAEIDKLAPERIVISPGPGRPRDAGISVAVVKRFAGKIPILGVCLGHQAIGAAYGGKIVEAKVPMHGKVSDIHHDGKTIFRGIRSPLQATRYHSLVVARKWFPRPLEVSAETGEEGDKLVMALRHKKHLVEGVQFHPESIMTTDGKRILANFLKLGTPTKLRPGHGRVVNPSEGRGKPSTTAAAEKAPRKARRARSR